MITLSFLCNIPWWLLWLLPLLLGLLAWLWWSNRYNSMVDDYESRIKGLNGRISGLEGELTASGKKKTELESDLALTKGRMREMEAEMTDLKTLNTSLTSSPSATSEGDKTSIDAISSSLSSDASDGSNTIAPLTAAGAGIVSSLTDSSKDDANDSGNVQSSSNTHDYSIIPNDNLQIIEGIGPKMESVLKENGVNTLNELGNKSPEELRVILDKYGDKYKIINPDTWPRQARLGADKQWDELIDLQKRLDGGVADAVGMTDSKLENMLNTGKIKAGTSTSTSPPKKSIYAGIKEDNLQIIEGIGPKMEAVLKENGINTLAALGSKSESDLQTILNKYGDKYKIIDPGTWARQAKLAGDGQWEALIDLQKKLDTGRDNAAGMTDSKLEKYLIKTGAIRSFKQDDLTAIEGIGPATNKLLKENGINTWRELADSSVERIKSILDSAGSRFSLADPGTWPKQAQLAADGDFDKLREYQDFLDGGK